MQQTREQPNLWDYSLALYKLEGVAPACLILQDQHGFDVNLILFCLWYGSQNGRLSRETLQEALELSKYWSELAVLPLRSVRTAIKADPLIQALPEAEYIATLREQVKKLELSAEKIQQTMLERLVTEDTGRTLNEENDDGGANDAGETNLTMLTAAMSLELDCKAQPQMQTILTARTLLNQDQR